MFTPEMLESVKKVEATRAARMQTESRRMTAEEKDTLLKAFHPDYRADGFAETGETDSGISICEICLFFEEEREAVCTGGRKILRICRRTGNDL